MPTTKISPAALTKVSDADSLLAFLKGSLGWPIAAEEFEDVSVEVGETRTRGRVRQLLRFRNDDPFLVFLVETPATARAEARAALREIRRQIGKEGRYADYRVADLVFIVASEGYEHIEFVRFIERGSKLPKLKAFGWSPATAGKTTTVRTVNLPALSLESRDGRPDWKTAAWNRAWDVETVTKEFFKGFDRLRGRTLEAFADAYPTDEGARGWAVSVALNRLLFVWFLAEADLLPGGTGRLEAELACGDFHARYFLPLCLEALGSSGGHPDFPEVPYLNGGLFELHPVEVREDGARIVARFPDSLYREWFSFLGAYQWTLSENDAVDTISPHILGYLFERYVNQKQMGAYYTKEDVTNYIARSVLIPRLFDRIGEEAGKAVRFDIGAMSREGNRRYIFPSVKQSSDLPTETPYERARRDARVRTLESTDLSTVDSFVTHNLNLELLAEDWIATRRDPAELWRAYGALSAMTVLDPTVGSGAFLLAALEILAPLYEAMLDRMGAMLQTMERNTHGVPLDGSFGMAVGQMSLEEHRRAPELDRMEAEFEEVSRHPNRAYFVRKRILLRNLYGVDLQAEAVEICKLRLYLALVTTAKGGGALEPLPDVDLNYRAGNALVGFGTLDAVHKGLGNPAGQGSLAFWWAEEEILKKSILKIAEIKRREEQNEDSHELKDEVEEQRRLAVGSLDKRQAELRNKEYDEAFQKSHRPFHWVAEFPTVLLERGGFDCIIGNPPYKNFRTKDKKTGRSIADEYKILGFQTEKGSDLYSLCMERAFEVMKPEGRFGMIVPLSITFSGVFADLRGFVERRSEKLWHVSFDNIPDRLFSSIVIPGEKSKEDGEKSKANQQRTTIVLVKRGERLTEAHGGMLHRWTASTRDALFSLIELSPDLVEVPGGVWAKVRSADEVSLLKALHASPKRLGDFAAVGTAQSLVVPKTAGYYISAYPEAKARNKQMSFNFRDLKTRGIAFALINSNVFFWWYRVYGDGFDVLETTVSKMPSPTLEDSAEVLELAKDVEAATANNVVYKKYRGEMVPNVNLNQDLDLLRRVDRALLRAYGVPDSPDWFLTMSKSNSFVGLDVPKSLALPDETDDAPE